MRQGIRENPGPEEASLPGMDGGNGSHGLDRSGRSHSAAPAACAVPPALPEAAAEVPPAAASRAGSGIAHPPGGGGGSRRAQGGYAAFMRDSLGDAPPAAEGSAPTAFAATPPNTNNDCLGACAGTASPATHPPATAAPGQPDTLTPHPATTHPPNPCNPPSPEIPPNTQHHSSSSLTSPFQGMASGGPGPAAPTRQPSHTPASHALPAPSQPPPPSISGVPASQPAPHPPQSALLRRVSASQPATALGRVSASQPMAMPGTAPASHSQPMAIPGDNHQGNAQQQVSELVGMLVDSSQQQELSRVLGKLGYDNTATLSYEKVAEGLGHLALGWGDSMGDQAGMQIVGTGGTVRADVGDRL
ncbi:MAG: hypothetical protein WDW36_002879 [Sanguina aurantia]